MNFIQFRNKMFDLACFNVNQVYAWRPDFDRNNLSRWVKKGLLIRLRKGYYAFPEYTSRAGYAFYFANRIYRPSYISLHSALSFYGMIPEAVVQITSVTPLKTAYFANESGEYSYKSLKESLFFGYELKPFDDGKTMHIARPEKALLDLLYLYPFYNTIRDMEDLRMDEDFFQETLNKDRLKEYAIQFRNQALKQRAGKLLKAYEA